MKQRYSLALCTLITLAAVYCGQDKKKDDDSSGAIDTAGGTDTQEANGSSSSGGSSSSNGGSSSSSGGSSSSNGGSSSSSGGSSSGGSSSSSGGSSSSSGGSSYSLQAQIARAQVAYQRFKVATAGDYRGSFTVALQGAASTASKSKAPVEMYFLDSNRREYQYQRRALGAAEFAFHAAAAGEYSIAFRNTLKENLNVSFSSFTGDVEAKGIENLNDSTETTHKDILLKAALGFSPACTTENSQYMTAVRNSRETLDSNIKTVNAPTGEYFVQPFIFYGRVGSDKKVTRLSSASISLVVGTKTIVLKTIDQFPEHTLNVPASGSEAYAYVRAEYGGFIGAAGEFYTLDTFRKRGNCDQAISLPLSADPGKDKVELVIEDSSVTPAINERISIRVTRGAAVNMYKKDNTQQSSWDLCSYNNNTGVPYNYSQGSGACNEISISAPPSAKIVAKPSELYKGTATTESDPSRILFFGRSLSRAFMNAMVANMTANANDALPRISFKGCLFNGGLVSLEAALTQSFLPTEEFGFAKGDIFSLGTRVGTYTQLSKFYQGAIDASGELSYSRNIPISSSSVTYKKITSVSSECSLNSDSGVYASAIANYGIYPGDEGMYGVVVD